MLKRYLQYWEYGIFKEPFPNFDDDEPKAGKKPEPPKEEKKPFNWVGVAIAVVAAVVIVGVIAAAAPVAAVAWACAGVGFAVAAGADVLTQYAQYKADGSKGDFGSTYRLDQTIINASYGAISAAFAAVDIPVSGQRAINGAIGGVQAALNGGNAKDIALGIGEGVIIGHKGGDGYKPTLRFSDNLHVKDGLQAVKKGILWGVGVSGINTAAGDVIEKAKECFSNGSKENSGTVPAT